MLKKLFLLVLLLVCSLNAMDVRLNAFPGSQVKYERAINEHDQDAAFDLGLLYQLSIKDQAKAIYWYEKSYEFGSSSAALNLGNLYKDDKQYNKAIKWYKKAYARKDKKAALALGIIYEQVLKNTSDASPWYEKAYKLGDMRGAYNLALLYESINNPNKALEWYKKAAKGGYADSINNLGVIYLEQGKNIQASAYYIALIAYGEPKDDIINFLKNDQKLTAIELQKAYKLQQTLDIPKHYTGGID